MSTFDFLRPSIKQAEDNYNSKKQEFITTKDKFESLNNTYTAKLEYYQNAVCYINGITIVSTILSLNRDQYKAFVATYSNAAPLALKPNVPPKVVKHFEEVTGGSYILNGLIQFETLKNEATFNTIYNNTFQSIYGVDELLYGVALSGIANLDAAKDWPAPLTILLSMPLTSILMGPALALDLAITIFAPGVKKQKFENATAEIEGHLVDMRGYINELDKTIKAINSQVSKLKLVYTKLMFKLFRIAPYAVNLLNLASIISDDKFREQFEKTFELFGIIPQIKNDYIKALADDPTITFKVFQVTEILMVHRAPFSKSQVQAIFKAIEKKSI